MQLVQLNPVVSDDPLIGAGCTMNAADVRARLREWAALRDRSLAIRPIAGGVSISLATSEPMSKVADLVGRESECCAFYTFVLRMDGQSRDLDISAGPGREIAVQALLGISPS